MLEFVCKNNPGLEVTHTFVAKSDCFLDFALVRWIRASQVCCNLN